MYNQILVVLHVWEKSALFAAALPVCEIEACA